MHRHVVKVMHRDDIPALRRICHRPPGSAKGPLSMRQQSIPGFFRRKMPACFLHHADPRETSFSRTIDM
jgi:hypothetical protein